jgi:hypothetical protein
MLSRKGLELWGLKRGSAAPASDELRLEPLPALPANPGRTRGCGGGLLEGEQRGPLQIIVHPQLRPGFQHRQIAQGARQILIAQLAVDSGGDQHIAGVRDLQQCGSSKHPLHDRFPASLSQRM